MHSTFYTYRGVQMNNDQKDKNLIIHINLDRGNGTDDAQCAYNRSGN